MKKGYVILSALAMLLAVACNRQDHFITDKGYRASVEADYEARMAGFPMVAPRLDTLPLAEREAMEFLYAYMPLPDLADYEPSFFLAQVRTAFEARRTMSWGREVPEDVFRHFVLVHRVNNENLDTARMAFFRELRGRVQGLTMEEAALEVNHWCHEHVAYRASDSRTSAPLATMRTSLGRCGEESTFTVTALRAVGIPARQCYTPRWAHCDDNHAWVEVWVDGQWKFMGACEPDPRLDMGWFSVPSTRCMMVHTKAFGRYKGDEEVVRRTGLFSELNLLCHYAPTRRVTVTVHDAEGRPLPGAQVKFKLYNYAEYYPLATMTADAEGRASLTTGLGDLLIWATDGDRFAFQKLDVRLDSTLTLALPAQCTVLPSTFAFEMVPPAAGSPKVVATAEEAAANALRLAYEDSLRAAYTATFHSASGNPFVRKSEGNYAEVERFIASHPDCADYLSTFSDKDLRDITADVLEAHWTTPDSFNCQLPIYKKGILPARISNEMVRPYRRELAAFRGMSAEAIRQWVADSIAVNDTGNYYNCPVSPAGVYKLRHADRRSRDIFFVAACRAAGVPAYMDNATGDLFAWNNQQWTKMQCTTPNCTIATSKTSTTSSTSKTIPTTQITLTYRGTDPAKPSYWPHFTLARLEGGDLRTFDFEDDPRMASFPATLTLEPGTYCLSTGNRYADGAVRSRLEFFEVKPGEHATREIIILPLLARTDELAKLNPSMQLFDGVELWDYAGKTGFLYVNLGNYSEPSKHLIVELSQLQNEVKQWGGMTFMVGPATAGMAGWGLANTDLAYQSGEMEQRIVEALKLDKVEFPLVALIGADGTIRYHSTGYKIGAVEQVLKAARQ